LTNKHCKSRVFSEIVKKKRKSCFWSCFQKVCFPTKKIFWCDQNKFPFSIQTFLSIRKKMWFLRNDFYFSIFTASEKTRHFFPFESTFKYWQKYYVPVLDPSAEKDEAFKSVTSTKRCHDTQHKDTLLGQTQHMSQLSITVLSIRYNIRHHSAL